MCTGHPNVRAFVTHGGMGGSSETIHCGVPVVVTPMYGDQVRLISASHPNYIVISLLIYIHFLYVNLQHLNAAALVARGIGKILNFNDISKENMLDALHYVLLPEVQENARQVSHAYRNRLNTPLETALWWIEHVAETKGAPLIRSRAPHVPVLIYYSLDVYVTIVIALMVCIVVLTLTVRSMLGKRKRSSASASKKNKAN